MPAKFITFEGVDGCGKSTISKEVCQALIDMGHEVEWTMEPSENWLGDQVRRSYSEEISPFTEAFLFLADRATHTDRIRKHLADGKIVISDRYSDSTIAYQGALLSDELIKQGIDSVDWLWELNNRIIIKPDVTFLLDIAPEISLERLNTREELSKFERQGYLEKVRANYLRIASREDRYVIIDATQAKQTVLNEVLLILKEKV